MQTCAPKEGPCRISLPVAQQNNLKCGECPLLPVASVLSQTTIYETLMALISSLEGLSEAGLFFFLSFFSSLIPVEK